jgi:hypothetical protein
VQAPRDERALPRRRQVPFLMDALNTAARVEGVVTHAIHYGGLAVSAWLIKEKLGRGLAD